MRLELLPGQLFRSYGDRSVALLANSPYSRVFTYSEDNRFAFRQIIGQFYDVLFFNPFSFDVSSQQFLAAYHNFFARNISKHGCPSYLQV